MAEQYRGVKFVTEMVGMKVPSDKRIDRLIYWCGIFDKKGLAPPYDGGSYGNLSFRLKPGRGNFVITAAQSGLADSTSLDRFVEVNEVDFDRGVVKASGARNPSSESMVHAAIYNHRPEVNAIFHGHCKAISENAERLGIPITKQEAPYGTLALVDRVLEIINTPNTDGMMEMRNHGFISLGINLDDAGKRVLRTLNQC